MSLVTDGATSEITAVDVSAAWSGILARMQEEDGSLDLSKFDRMINFRNKDVYQNDSLIDPNATNANGVTNKELMKSGNAPYGPDGNRINLHHIDQTDNGPMAELSQTYHQQDYNDLHTNTGKSASSIDRGRFKYWKKKYWENRSNDF